MTMTNYKCVNDICMNVYKSAFLKFCFMLCCYSHFTGFIQMNRRKYILVDTRSEKSIEYGQLKKIKYSNIPFLAHVKSRGENTRHNIYKCIAIFSHKDKPLIAILFTFNSS